MMNFLRTIIVTGIVLFISCAGQNLNAQVQFSKGVNLTSWFQTNGSKQIQFTKYTKKDFENIKSLGCDVVRLPINLFYMTKGAPEYTIDPLFYSFLDQVVGWAGELKIYLIIDNHSTDDIASKNPKLETILIKVWQQMAAHYTDSSKYIIYEVLNEPNGITTEKWAPIQQKAVNAIRESDTKHTVMVGGANFNSYADLALLPVYSDTNLIYTFHFYEPFLFTHQGATWPTPSLGPLSGIPFPYTADSMPGLPTVFNNTWVESAYNNYSNEGTINHVKELIDIAKDFKNTRNVKVYCGEFGAYKPTVGSDDRVFWYGVVRQYLEQCDIPWTIWDYQGTFGIFNNGSNEMFENDVNIPLVDTLGFNIPEQHPYELKADSVGFTIYSDFIGEKAFEASYPLGGTVDYYSTDKPNNGNYCLYWTGSSQYGAISLNYTPDKDLSQLVDENYAVSFLVRGNSPGTKLEVRFLDSKTTDPTDHPWRMNYTVSENLAAWDGYWHPVYIPLANFVDMGSWDNAWFNPIGAFDWKAVDKFEITTDQGALTGKSFWFDNIMVTNQDTAKVYENSIFTGSGVNDKNTGSLMRSLFTYPNPTSTDLTVNYKLQQADDVHITVFNIDGRKVRTLINKKQGPGEFQLIWDLCNEQGQRMTAGIYLVQGEINGIKTISKIIISN